MPSYEALVILRQMPRQEVITTLKRTAEAIFSKGGFIRKLDNLGHRTLPFRVFEHGIIHKTGTAFNITFDSPSKVVFDLNEEYGRDVDIVRSNIFKAEEPVKIKCTLQEELQPPAYRKGVIRMLRIARKGQKEKYPLNTGLNYYPFQK
ncbi:CLUMA_CG011922, isoform A [Clunio marinus]|uniref:Small ribosomal subunit protein bS6m n=1 Tax=Clunio marinus TaxID=568069 RepID=A0A1J1IET7_9DIPT|nr:CLUMA_CG011922, isoform A [Clunio marinus]